VLYRLTLGRLLISIGDEAIDEVSCIPCAVHYNYGIEARKEFNLKIFHSLRAAKCRASHSERPVYNRVLQAIRPWFVEFVIQSFVLELRRFPCDLGIHLRNPIPI
jgi:hypothetical protein